MASGMIVHFTINPDLVGIAIGKKGARIKQVEKDSGVTSVNVDGKSGTAERKACQVCRLLQVHLSPSSSAALFPSFTIVISHFFSFCP
jgi:KH domain